MQKKYTYTRKRANGEVVYYTVVRNVSGLHRGRPDSVLKMNEDDKVSIKFQWQTEFYSKQEICKIYNISRYILNKILNE